MVTATALSALPLPGIAPKKVTVLGTTGSIGQSTVKLLEQHADAFEVVALTAHRNVALLADQAKRLRAKRAVVGDETLYAELRDALAGSGIEAAAGDKALQEAAAMPSDLVVAGIVGAAGLAPTLEAVRRGATVALANKECLVCAGELFLGEIQKHNATLLPVDSEHSAIFQVFDFEHPEGVEKIILTASGGPFRHYTREQMRNVTPAQAVNHPNWSMGAKISIDSATMMNKGLELIEAFYLFPVKEKQIEILVHPESIVHSMVAYVDGSVLAQMGTPNMCTPIAYALAWPERIATPAARLDLARIGTLHFEEPDAVRFPALRLAREALRQGGAAPTVLNAANEVAVQRFLDGKIGFLDIARVVEQTLDATAIHPLSDIAAVVECDRAARLAASAISDTMRA
ncbi:MAG: 1-deoxy-D-xylulose-5-phosphate reductoisomerase [Alphaproteobacteria bacterium]|nr:1-deoxy-D-xylulose-5-phosphate reductoisomerase [Alphaproteobacteria bacterium]